MSKRKKKMTGYKKSLLIWFLLLLIASEACLIYVSTTLKMYEKVVDEAVQRIEKTRS